jgi:hypothetical protein
MSEPTTDQERAAIVNFLIRLWDDACNSCDKPFDRDVLHDAAFKICNGEHWPKKEEPMNIEPVLADLPTCPHCQQAKSLYTGITYITAPLRLRCCRCDKLFDVVPVVEIHYHSKHVED